MSIEQPPPRRDQGVFISNDQIYRKLLAVESRLIRLEARSHERRIRRLERWRYSQPVAGALSLVALIKSVIPHG